MKTIRKSVFETNSSSTHSICITKNNSLYPSSVHFTIGNFGWEVATYKDTHTKAQYLYTALCNLQRFELINHIENILNCFNIEATFERLQCDSDGYYDCYENGYIDHSSDLHEFVSDVCHNPDKLLRYLFSEKSFLKTGNDNSDDDRADIEVDYECDTYYKSN